MQKWPGGVIPPLPWESENWLTSPSRLGMSAVARSIYRDLLDYQWRDGSFPEEARLLAQMAGVTAEELAVQWPIVQSHFTRQRGGGRLFNRKLQTLRDQEIMRMRSGQQQASARTEIARLGGLAKSRKMKALAATSTATARASPLLVAGHKQAELLETEGLALVPCARGRRTLSLDISCTKIPGNGYNPQPGWEKFQEVFPVIRKPDLALQVWLSICDSEKRETEILAGARAYLGSDEVHRGVVTSAENWLRDRMWEGKFWPARTERRRLEDL